MNATICILSLSCWRTTKNNRKAGDEVTSRAGVARDVARVLVTIADHPAMDRLEAIHAKAYATHRRLSLDSGTDNFRLIPAARLLEHQDALDALEAQHNREVASIIAAYPALRDSAPNRLQTLYEPGKWPADISDKFGFSRRYLPAPTVGPWAEWAEEAAETATADFRGRLIDAARKVAAGLGTGGKVYASTLDNLAEILRDADVCNLTNDPVIAELSRAARSATVAGVDALRESVFARAEARESITSALKKYDL